MIADVFIEETADEFELFDMQDDGMPLAWGTFAECVDAVTDGAIIYV